MGLSRANVLSRYRAIRAAITGSPSQAAYPVHRLFFFVKEKHRIRRGESLRRHITLHGVSLRSLRLAAVLLVYVRAGAATVRARAGLPVAAP